MCSGPGLGCLSLLEQQKEPCQLLKEVLLYNAVNLTYSSLWDLTQVSQRSILFSTDSFIRFLLKRSFRKTGCFLSLGSRRKNIWIKKSVQQMDFGYKDYLWLQKFLTETGVKPVSKFLAFTFSWRRFSPPIYALCRPNRKWIKAQRSVNTCWILGMYSPHFLFIWKELYFYTWEKQFHQADMRRRERGDMWDGSHARPPVWVGSVQWRAWKVMHGTSCWPLLGAVALWPPGRGWERAHGRGFLGLLPLFLNQPLRFSA